jgi:hypothetical protein
MGNRTCRQPRSHDQSTVIRLVVMSLDCRVRVLHGKSIIPVRPLWPVGKIECIITYTVNLHVAREDDVGEKERVLAALVGCGTPQGSRRV